MVCGWHVGGNGGDALVAGGMSGNNGGDSTVLAGGMSAVANSGCGKTIGEVGNSVMLDNGGCGNTVGCRW